MLFSPTSRVRGAKRAVLLFAEASVVFECDLVHSLNPNFLLSWNFRFGPPAIENIHPLGCNRAQFYLQVGTAASQNLSLAPEHSSPGHPEGHCQRKVRRAKFSAGERKLGRSELTPLGKCSGAVELEMVP